MKKTKTYEYKNLTIRPTLPQEKEMSALKKHLNIASKSQVYIKAVSKYIIHENEINELRQQVRELNEENGQMKKDMNQFITAQIAITEFAKEYKLQGHFYE